ncbi:glycosyltransferase [Lactobacillus delbrueckii subsp. bulgaricus]|nr:hypothetical protein [Lactobacillus delbrueckii subsp. bulgaricus]MBT9005898.1 hypothetical protein [Lactobacillus delbrueckii subsp. bulgaricus]MBT9007658.1 hypothetical protein [Lactobacillus delbrueckii subsp. bulgaricus]MBT9014072.1 hypothetical protein [Lactobacillus delbrueckii subsp. bulgaricus]
MTTDNGSQYIVELLDSLRQQTRPVQEVIVLPSIWNDPAPLAVIESITAGKPLITTYLGGIPEYADKKDTIILPINDQLVENLVNSLTKLANDKKLRISIEEAAKKRSQTWTKESFYDDFVEKSSL